MGFLQNVENFFETTETEVEGWLVDIKTGVAVLETDISKAINWVSSNAPAIATAVQEVEAMIAQIEAVTPGAAQNKIVTQAIADANIAVTELNAFATAANSGTSTATTLIAGYAAVQNGLAAASSAKAAVANFSTGTLAAV